MEGSQLLQSGDILDAYRKSFALVGLCDLNPCGKNCSAEDGDLDSSLPRIPVAHIDTDDVIFLLDNKTTGAACVWFGGARPESGVNLEEWKAKFNNSNMTDDHGFRCC